MNDSAAEHRPSCGWMSNKSSESQAPHVTEPAAERPRSGDTSRVRVHGEPVLQMPRDLYIPPDALEVILESFEGPLDLLLYLIRKQNLDILDIPIADITRQYMGYIEMMHELMRLELASEYLLMAAILAEIKSRLLLPRPPAEEGLEEDRSGSQADHRPHGPRPVPTVPGYPTAPGCGPGPDSSARPTILTAGQTESGSVRRMQRGAAAPPGIRSRRRRERTVRLRARPAAFPAHPAWTGSGPAPAAVPRIRRG